MIRKRKGGYVVLSHKGKKLSRTYRSKKAAAKRLGQIEWFKHHPRSRRGLRRRR